MPNTDLNKINSSQTENRNVAASTKQKVFGEWYQTYEGTTTDVKPVL